MSKKPSLRNSMLSALMTGDAAPEQKSADPRAHAPAPFVSREDSHQRVSAGAVGALKNTLAHITRDGRVVELDPAFILPSPYPDRMEGAESEAAIDTLAQSIASAGQEVPVLVRPHPQMANYYQTIYGHRRIRAVARLGAGAKVRAVIKDLSDGELLLAQGLENSARQDLSWIEKAMFARRLEAYAREAGRDPTAMVMEALALHAPDVSRFRTTLDAIPEDIVRVIGAAGKIGRTKWLKLYTCVKSDPSALLRMRRATEKKEFSALSSDDRFGAVLKAATYEPAASADPSDGALFSPAGERIASIERKKSAVQFTVTDRDFAAYVEKRLGSLHHEFLSGA